MSRTSPARTLLRSAGAPAIALILMGVFLYYAALGPNGLIANKEVSRQLDQRNAEYRLLETRRNEIRNRVNLLGGSGGADPDLAEEEVRKQLNLVRPDEVLVPLPAKK